MVFPTPNGVYVLQYNSQGVGALKVAIRSSTPRFLRKIKQRPGQHGAAFSEAISFAEQRRRQQPTNDFIPSTTSQVQGFPPQQSGSPSPNEDR